MAYYKLPPPVKRVWPYKPTTVGKTNYSTNSNSPIIRKVVSGGQTGADQGGLNAAQWAGIPTGGYAPLGWKTETGPNLGLAEYGLVEWHTSSYKERTIANVELADGTLIFGKSSAGSLFTAKECFRLKKPYLWIYMPQSNPKHKINEPLNNIWIVWTTPLHE